MRVVGCLCWLLCAACATSSAPQAPARAQTPSPAHSEAQPPDAGMPIVAPRFAAMVAAADRSTDDRALDLRRRPGELLTFLDVAPGAQVAELGVGGGYTTELLARAVGPKGRVYGQNSHFILEKFAGAPWAARLQKPVMSPVVRVDREFDDPLPPEAQNLDLVVSVLFYHDTVWMKVDRAKMNLAIYNALKPGGTYVIVDHSARHGSGVSETETLHRIDEGVVIAEIEHAGFHLQTEGHFLNNPQDTRDWSASPRSAGERRGTSDRFVLKFVK